jgi:aminopeptidase
MALSFEHMLAKYAELTVHVGLGIRPGQRLIIRAPIEAAPFVRLVSTCAYKAGCRYVDVQWFDDSIELIRYQHAPRDSFEEYPVYRTNGRLEYARNGDASLSVYAEDPDLLKDQDPELIATAMRTARKHGKPILELLQRNAYNWCVVSIPIPSWSSKVFPDIPPQEAEAKLWEAIYKVCRLDTPDPVASWKSHITELSARSHFLTNRQYHALKIKGPGTDLTIGLPTDHIWISGQDKDVNGTVFTPNLPTEETATTPHKDKVDGFVSATKPLSYAGSLIEGFSLTFERGVVTNFQAKKGERLLGTLLETDEGARRLGEVALVPNSSPISQLGILFYNVLFDENAACHLALGSAYRSALKQGVDMSNEEFFAAGGNDSQIHEDFMVGSNEIDIDGIYENGLHEAIMRQGEWAFSIEET